MSFLGKLHVLDLAGTPHERGRQHGEALRAQIIEHHAQWVEAISDDLGEPAGPYLDGLVEQGFLATAQRLAPDLLDELHGLSEGSGIGFARTFARMLSDEEPWVRMEYARDCDTAPKGCSSVGSDAGPDAPLLIAQTMDVPTWWDGGQTLLRFTQPNGDRALVFTVAGKISLCGMTANGLAITCNSLLQLDNSRAGLAEDLVVRTYLASGTPAAGHRFLWDIPHASGQNYIVPDGMGRAVSLECAADGVSEWRHAAGDRVVAHSNHPVANPHQQWFQAMIAGMSDEARMARFGFTTESRLETLYRLIDPAQPLDVDAAKALLACREGPICRVGEVEGKRDGFSFGSLVMELGETHRLHLAPGPADRTPWQVFEA
jgi:isopenicillin-N N-acyltransferase-like protein